MRIFKQIPTIRFLIVLLSLLALGGTVGVVRWQTAAPNVPNVVKDADAATQPGAAAAREKGEKDDATRAFYSISGRAGDQTPIREDDLHALENYWWNRLTYPTGRLPNWAPTALQQDSRIASGVPGGQVTYNRKNSLSPLALDPNRFTSLGPMGEQTDGCYNCYNYGIVSGRGTDVRVDPVTPNVAYLATAGGGVWKTTNCCSAATTWQLTTDMPSVAASGVDNIAIDPNNHAIVYVGTGEANFAIDNQGAYGLLKSTDSGNSWTLKGTDVFTPSVYWSPLLPSISSGGAVRYQAVGKVRVDPRNSANVVAGTMRGLYFSYNGGDTWSGPCYTNPVTDTQFMPVTGLLLSNNQTSTVVYAATGSIYGTANGVNGVYSTTMPLGGCPASWNLLNNGWPSGTGDGTPSNSKPGRIDLAQAPSASAVIYAQVHNPATNGQLGVWRTTDAGATWTQQSDASALDGCGFDYNQNWYDQGLVVDPNNPNTVYMDTYDIWKSTDGGVTFQDITCGYGGGTTEHVDQHGLAFAPGSSSTLLAVSDGGSYVTLNANVISPTLPSWNQLNVTLSTLQFYSGGTTGNVATSATLGASGGLQDNGSPVNLWNGQPGPAQWQMRIGGDGFFSRIEPVLAQHWYQGNNSGHIWVSDNGPYSVWHDVTGGWRTETQSFILPFELYKDNCPPSGCTHLIVGSYRVWETITGGLSATSWYSNSVRLTRGTGSRSYINQLAYAPSDQTVALVGTNDGYVQYGVGLGQGTPLSATWVNVTTPTVGIAIPNRAVNDVAIDPTNPLIGYAAVGGYNTNTPTTPGHVFQITCTANCASFTWVDKTGALPDIPADSIIVNPRYAQQVFVGNEWGLYYTNDINANPPTWMRFDAGLPHAMVWDLTTDMGNTVLEAWTHGRGAYVWPLTSGPFVQPSATPTVTGTPPTPGPSATATATETPGPCFLYNVITSTAVITPGLNDVGNHCDDCASSVPLPFPVQLYDRTFNVGYADSNGAFALGPATASLYNGCLPDRNEQYTLQLYQNDLCTTSCGGATCPTCGVFTSTLGTAPNRQFVVEYRAIHYGVQEVPNDFEVVFTEGSTTISYIYGTTSDQGAGETVGLQQTASTRWTQFSCDAPNLTPGLRVDFVESACPTPTPGPSATATPTSCAITFTDVHPTDYFYEPVRYLYCHGVISGYGDNTFRPYNFTTRSQMVKIVVLGFGIPIQTPAGGAYTFHDVTPANPFFAVIETAAAHNIISGYNCGPGGPGPCDPQNRPYFLPYNLVTRGQLSKIDVIAAGWPQINPTTPTFTDVPRSNPFYTVIETAVCHGVVSGYADHTFHPFANATRGQISKIVYLSITNAPGACTITPTR